MRIAHFGPLPPSPTGVADYGRLLLARLRARRPEWRWESYTGAGDAPHPESLCVYQMGNSRFHDFVYERLFRHPGVLVLHDLVLHHARLASFLDAPEVAAYRADLGDREKRARALARLAEYAAEVEACYPGRGETVAEIALRMGGGRFFYEHPLFELAVRASKMTLVHGPHARERVLQSCPASAVRVVRMGIELPEPVPREEARRRLGLGPGWILASFGLVTPEKRIAAALGALKRLCDAGIDAQYLLVGGRAPHFDAVEQARRRGVEDRVHCVGRVSEEDFWLYAFAADLCLNLRYPTAGETSATLLRLLAAGRVVLITDQVHHLDLPDRAVVRTRLEGEEDGLYCDLRDLMGAPERRRRIEIEARRFVETEHGPEAMADDYLDWLEEAAELPAPEAELPPHLT